MANNEDDKEFNDYLKGGSDLSNSYRETNTIEPPAHLNEKILLAAKEAVTESKQKPNPVFHKSPWALPVSVAAVITLSVSLIVTMQQEIGRPLISGPEVELYDSEVLLEEVAIPQSIAIDEDLSIVNEVEGQRSKEDRVNKNTPAPASFSAADTFRSESEPKRLNDELKLQPMKKALSKERVGSIASEEQVLEKQQSLQSAPAELDEITGLKRERQFIQQENKLLSIKELWGVGDFNRAKQTYDEFLKENPDFNLEYIKNILGLELYQALNK